MQKGCPKCGRFMDENIRICPYCNYDFKETNYVYKRIENEKENEGKYAGFIKRLVAGIIDIYINALITIIISRYLLNTEKLFIIITVFIIIYIFTNSIMERTKWHGTIGKHIVKIETVDENENPLTLEACFIRNIIKLINILTLGIGFLTCATTPSKQTLADRITNTYVLNKVDLYEEKKHDFASTLKRIIAFIIDIVIIIIQTYIACYIFNYIMNKAPNLDEMFKPYKNMINSAIIIIISLLYFPLQESVRGKTIGKKYLKIAVTDMNEEYISFVKAFIREILIIIDFLTLAFLLPLSDKRKQTLKDKLTKTIVIDS